MTPEQERASEGTDNEAVPSAELYDKLNQIKQQRCSSPLVEGLVFP